MNTTAASNDEHGAEERKETKEGSVPYAGGSSIQSRSRIPGGGGGSIDGDKNSPRRECSGASGAARVEPVHKTNCTSEHLFKEQRERSGRTKGVLCKMFNVARISPGWPRLGLHVGPIRI
jgi:hypothetical protein